MTEKLVRDRIEEIFSAEGTSRGSFRTARGSFTTMAVWTDPGAAGS